MGNGLGNGTNYIPINQNEHVSAGQSKLKTRLSDGEAELIIAARSGINSTIYKTGNKMENLNWN